MTTFDVSPGDIRRHADAVDDIARMLGQMQEAGSVSGDSYGVLLSWLPGVINGASGDVAGALSTLASTSVEAANGLRSMADQYARDDADASFALRSSYP